ncbi:DNA internalization-related competence protein ComEC/Rec2 [Virgibacillus ainsalahensis]
MKGYWHFTAISVAISILTVISDNYWFIAGLLLWLFYLYFKERLGKIPITISLTFFLFFILYIPSIDETNIPSPPQSIQHSGHITGPVTSTNEKLEFLFEDQSENKVSIIYFPDEDTKNSPPIIPSDIKYGAACKIIGKMEMPPEGRNPGQFDYGNYLLTQGISYQLVVQSLDEIQCEGSTFLHRIFKLRTDLMANVNKNVSQYTSAWLIALVLGEDSQISEDTIELFQKWSLSHILAISGLHIGLIVALIYFLLIKLNLLTKEKAQLVMLVFLPVYALIAGGEPSVLRASAMVLIFIIINKVKLKFSVTDVLSISFLILILLDEYIVYHVGFQLSFLVTLALILSRKWITETDSSFFQILQIGFVSQMMILPLLFAYFSLFQPLSIILNWLIVPYFSLFVIPLMFILLLLTPLPSYFTSVFDTIFVLLNKEVIGFIEFVDAHADFPWIMGPLPLLFVLVYYILFFALMKNLQPGNLKHAFQYGIGIVILIICIAIKPYFSPSGTVTMLDIGQGDAFIIELPYREGVILIDAGSTFSFEDMKPTENVYKQMIKPYLYSRGISKIDAVFLTHEDIDHNGSLSYIIEEIDVEKVILSKFYELTNETAQSWESNDIEVSQVTRDDTIRIGEQLFHVLAPYKNNLSPNENSLVLYTELGGKNWLFTGDIGINEEKELSRTYPYLQTDVLKVAHHGSNTSTDEDFISHINPEYALISVGENNSFGHPTAQVLEILDKEEVIILRTDEHGAVQYRFKYNNGTFFKYLP